MNMIQLGKMYLVKQFFWFLYPTKELAATGPAVAGRPAGEGAEVAYRYAKQYSERFKCNVDVVEENTCFVLLKQSNIYFKVLDSNGKIGWIGCWDFSRYFELVKE